jgi:hypothetical protein
MVLRKLRDRSVVIVISRELGIRTRSRDILMAREISGSNRKVSDHVQGGE